MKHAFKASQRHEETDSKIEQQAPFFRTGGDLFSVRIKQNRPALKTVV